MAGTDQGRPPLEFRLARILPSWRADSLRPRCCPRGCTSSVCRVYGPKFMLPSCVCVQRSANARGDQTSDNHTKDLTQAREYDSQCVAQRTLPQECHGHGARMSLMPPSADRTDLAHVNNTCRFSPLDRDCSQLQRRSFPDSNGPALLLRLSAAESCGQPDIRCGKQYQFDRKTTRLQGVIFSIAVD